MTHRGYGSIRVRVVVLALAAGALLFLATPAQAQIYLKIGGIEGESKDQKHSQWIELTNAQFSGMRPSSMASGAAKPETGTQSSTSMHAATGAVKGSSAPAPTPVPATRNNSIPPGPPSSRAEQSIVSPRDPQSGLPTGKRMSQQVVITKEVDKASPLLMQALTRHAEFNDVVMEFYRGGVLVERYRLNKVLVSSIHSSPSAAKAGATKGQETLTLVAEDVNREK